MILNKRPIIKILMAVMALVGAAMLIPAAVALIYKETNVFFSFIALPRTLPRFTPLRRALFILII